MDPNALAIPIAFILLSALLCLLLIGSKWDWKQKLALIVIVPAFGLAVWQSIGSYKGWPTTESPPDKALLNGIIIREPDKSINDKGAIYLWLMPFDDGAKPSFFNPLGYASPGGEPRCFALPYTRQAHEQLEGAQDLLRRGGRVVFRTRGKYGTGAAGDGEPCDSARGNCGNADGESGEQGDPNRRDFQIYELPPRHPPEKLPE